MTRRGRAARKRPVARALLSVVLGLGLTLLFVAIGLEAHARNSGYLTPVWRSEVGMVMHNPEPAFGHRQSTHRVTADADAAAYEESLEHLPWWAARSPAGSGTTIFSQAPGWPLPALRTVFDPSNPQARTISRIWGAKNQRDHWLVPNQIVWAGLLGNVAFFTTLMFLLLSITAAIKTRRRIAAGRCPRCNYDRAGLTAGSPCPECGTGQAPAAATA